MSSEEQAPAFSAVPLSQKRRSKRSLPSNLRMQISARKNRDMEEGGIVEPLSISEASPSGANVLDVIEKKKKVRHVNPVITRCSMNLYVKDRDELGFRECHKIIMRQTPFNAYVDNAARRQFNINFLEEILVAWRGKNLFRLGRKFIPFTREDVALILGVPCVGKPVPTSGPVQQSHLHKCFPTIATFDRRQICELINGLVSSDDQEDVDNTVRLWILLLFSTFLAPRTNYTCQPQMLTCLDRLQSLKYFAWADAFHDQILHKLGDAVDAATKNRKGEKAQPKSSSADATGEGFRFVYGCSAALCVWLLEHTNVQVPISRQVFPRILRWESSKKKKSPINIALLTSNDIVDKLEKEPQEELLIKGMPSNDASESVPAQSQVMNIVEREEREEKKEREDKEERAAKDERAEPSMAARLSQLSTELSSIMARGAEREDLARKETQKELNEFRGKLDLLSHLFKAGHAAEAGQESEIVCETTLMEEREERKEEIVPCDALDETTLNRVVEMAMTVPEVSEPQMSSITRGVKRRRGRQPSAYELSPFEKKIPVAAYGRKKIQKRGKSKPQPVIDVEQELSRPVASKSFTEERRNYCGHDLLSTEDATIVNSFLSEQIDGTVVTKTRWGGDITRLNIHEILFGAYISDDVIDWGVQKLLENTSQASEDYYSWSYVPTLVLHNVVFGKCKWEEALDHLMEWFPNLPDLDLMFFVIHTNNHWHLAVVDPKKKTATAYNSLKGNKLYTAAARNLVSTIDKLFTAMGTHDKPLALVNDDNCPTQPPSSGNCALYVIKFIENLSKRGELTWNFSEDDMPRFRGQLAADILRSQGNKTL